MTLLHGDLLAVTPSVAPSTSSAPVSVKGKRAPATALLGRAEAIPVSAAGAPCPRCGSTKVGEDYDPDYIFCWACFCTSFVGVIPEGLLHRSTKHDPAQRAGVPEYPQIKGRWANQFMKGPGYAAV